MKFNLRPFLFQAHVCAGLIVGLVLAIISLTGCFLLFKYEIDRALWADFFYVNPGEQRVPLDTLLLTAKTQFPDEKPVRFQVVGDPRFSVQIFTASKRTIFINPYTGKIIGTRIKEKTFVARVEALHCFFLLGDTGKIIQGASVMVLIFMVITGIFLWWPKSVRKLKQSLAIAWTSKGRPFKVSLHKVVGIYSALILLVSAFTGLEDAFEWVQHGLYGITGSAHALPAPKPTATVADGEGAALTLPIEAAWQRAQTFVPHPRDTFIFLPKTKEAALRISSVAESAPHIGARSELYFDFRNAGLLRFDPYEKQSIGQKIDALDVPLHTGLVGGIIWRIALFFGAASICVLITTGYGMYLKRLRTRQSQKTFEEVSTAINLR